MKAYEDFKYNEWRVIIENTLPEILKTNLLVKGASDLNLVMPLNTDPETGTFIIFFNPFFNLLSF